MKSSSWSFSETKLDLIKFKVIYVEKAAVLLIFSNKNRQMKEGYPKRDKG